MIKRSMDPVNDKGVHKPGPYFDGPGPRRGSMDQGSMFCTRETHIITRHYSAERQRAKQTLTTSKNSIEFTYSNFPCHLKVNRNKLAWINRPWKCKKGERLTINANSCTRLDQMELKSV